MSATCEGKFQLDVVRKNLAISLEIENDVKLNEYLLGYDELNKYVLANKIFIILIYNNYITDFLT